jgi:hypothetical protein
MMTVTRKDKNIEENQLTALEVLSYGFGMSMAENGSIETCNIISRMLIIAATSIKNGEFSFEDDIGSVKVVYKLTEPKVLPIQKH